MAALMVELMVLQWAVKMVDVLVVLKADLMDWMDLK